MANSNNGFSKILELFGVKDQNPNVQQVLDENTLVFTTNVFIPMEGNINSKSFFYLSGMVKLVETFINRTIGSGLSKGNKKCLLYIYYDSMFEQEYTDNKYMPKNSDRVTFNFNQDYNLEGNSQSNNEINTEIKKNYSKNKELLKKLLHDYKTYIDMIKANTDGRYNFIKLFSFNCDMLTRKKSKGYLGHPATFGSMVRFIPFFDPKIGRVFSINISHALSPRLCYLIQQWIESGKEMLTNSYDNYNYTDKQINVWYNLTQPPISNTTCKTEDKEERDEYEKVPNKKEIPIAFFEYRITAGLVGININHEKKLTMVDYFYEILLMLIKKENDREIIKSYGVKDPNDFFTMFMCGKSIDQKNNDWFFYGVDELILGILFKFRVPEENIYFFGDHNKKGFVLDEIINNKPNVMMFNLQKKIDYFKTENNIKKIYEEVMEEINETKEDFPKQVLMIVYYQVMLYQFQDLPVEELDRIAKIYKLIKKKIIDLFKSGKIRDLLEIPINKELFEYITSDEMIKYLETGNLSIGSDNNKPYTSQVLDFFAKIGAINPLLESFMYRNKDIHRYVSRSFIKNIGKEKEALSYYSGIDDDYNMYKLLCSYDEERPLVIGDSSSEKDQFSFLQNGGEHTNRFFTYLDIKNPRLVEQMISYYTNSKYTLHVPYTMGMTQSGGRYRKNIKRTLKNKYRKFNKHDKISRKNKKN